MLLSIKNLRLSMTTSGWVKSMTTSVPPSTKFDSGSPASTSADSSRSPAFLTASTIVAPTLPLAPITPTRMPCSLMPRHLSERRPSTQVLEDQRRLGSRDVGVGVEVLDDERPQV